MRYAAILFGLLLCFAANAQWTIINLHPPGAAGSGAGGGHNLTQSGGIDTGAGQVAGTWSSTAGSWNPIQNAGEDRSTARDSSGNTLVGWVTYGFQAFACLWTNNQTYVDLHPVEAGESWCMDISGNVQVGMAQFDVLHAGLWRGTAQSWEDLHPAHIPEAQASVAEGIDGDDVVGYAFFGTWRAAMWDGLTPESFRDITPDGIYEAYCYGVGDGQQVGKVIMGDAHASLWRGTAESWVDLHPAGATDSVAGAVDGGLQVGSATISGVIRASLWYGTAGSRVDLHSFLPQNSTYSNAGGIWQNGAMTYIPGGFYNPITARYEAVMWVSRAVAPTSYSMVRGSVFSGNLASLQNSENNRLVMRPGFVFSVGEPPVQVRLNATAPTASPNGFSFSVESSASFGSAQQKVWLWNYVLGDYELLDTRLATTTDDVVTVTVRTNPSRFIQPGTLAIRALVSYRAVGPAFAYPWSGRIDKVWWNFPG